MKSSSNTFPSQIIPTNPTATAALAMAKEQMLREWQEPADTPKHTGIYDAVHAAFAGLEITPGSNIH